MPPQLTGELVDVSPPSRTKDLAVHAGPSLPLRPSRPPIATLEDPSQISPNNNWLIAALTTTDAMEEITHWPTNMLDKWVKSLMLTTPTLEKRPSANTTHLRPLPVFKKSAVLIPQALVHTGEEIMELPKRLWLLSIPAPLPSESTPLDTDSRPTKVVS